MLNMPVACKYVLVASMANLKKNVQLFWGVLVLMGELGKVLKHQDCSTQHVNHQRDSARVWMRCRPWKKPLTAAMPPAFTMTAPWFVYIYIYWWGLRSWGKPPWGLLTKPSKEALEGLKSWCSFSFAWTFVDLKIGVSFVKMRLLNQCLNLLRLKEEQSTKWSDGSLLVDTPMFLWFAWGGSQEWSAIESKLNCRDCASTGSQTTGLCCRNSWPGRCSKVVQRTKRGREDASKAGETVKLHM